MAFPINFFWPLLRLTVNPTVTLIVADPDLLLTDLLLTELLLTELLLTAGKSIAFGELESIEYKIRLSKEH